MHVHDEQPQRKRPGPQRRSEPSDRVPDRGELDAAALIALQRTVGNAAVGRLVDEQQQAAAVHDVLRSAGRPLDTGLRTEMESRFDADFSDVRTHTDPAARRSAEEVGARAYTSGSHVVIGDDGADKQTLAHELTHVLQQRSGPVAGTDNGAGLRVSDPEDRFERAAEANAVRVMSGAAPNPPVQRTAGVSPQPSVQRADQEQDRGRPIVNMMGGGQWEAVNNPGRTDGIVLSGHGSWEETNPDFRVPAGTRVHLYTVHGSTVTDDLGGIVETGGQVGQRTLRSFDGRHVIRDYIFHPPDDLRIQGSPVVVTRTAAGYNVQLDPTQAAVVPVASLNVPVLRGRSITFSAQTRLSQILRPNMGDVHIAACLHYDIPNLHGRTRNQS